MQGTLEIDFRNIMPSAALSAAIRKRSHKLERFCSKIIACRVTIESPHHHHHQGARFEVHIRLTIPGAELVVSQQPDTRRHEDAFVAVHDAFDAAQRQLEDHVRRQRGDVKRTWAHETAP